MVNTHNYTELRGWCACVCAALVRLIVPITAGDDIYVSGVRPTFLRGMYGPVNFEVRAL